MTTPAAAPADLLTRWQAEWEPALAAWSRFTKLRLPRFCFTAEEEAAEHLSNSFAMIRLVDHTVVISLAQVAARGIADHAREILAHEIGHHVYAPGDLSSNARLIARMRYALPTREAMAPMLANMYTDLLINDRLQRAAGLDMAGVFTKLGTPEPGDRLFQVYLRMYEHLWSLPAGQFGSPTPPEDRALMVDAGLGARVIRAYARDFVAGAGRFAALLLPYLLEMKEQGGARSPWLDALSAGEGSGIPDGLAEMDPDEETGNIHPALDPALSGLAPAEGTGKEKVGGQKGQYRDPGAYITLMRSLGVNVDENALAIRYYRERALPHLVPFPSRELPQVTDPLPEGLEVWDPGSPLADIDWIETAARSPIAVIPGVTTVQRIYGTSEGGDPKREPIDVYIGIDCSGSMKNPRVALSYPVIAGAVIALSALRSGAQAMACLSGEPGQFSQTPGFSRNEREILGTLTGYLGTGYAFGIERLRATFLGGAKKPKRPTHVLVISDSDWFMMLKSVPDGYDVARDALLAAGGGGTCVLELGRGSNSAEIQRLESLGWKVHRVTNQAEMIQFAHAFSRETYGQGPRR